MITNWPVRSEYIQDFRKYYHLERYLFDEVRPRFAELGYLDAFDFFCIVIWKANRAKSRIAKKLLKEGLELDEAVKFFTYGIAQAPTPKERMQYMHEEGFELPMASAILTVLYPDEFTVYDKRVCDMLGGFHRLKSSRNFEALWSGYQKFKLKVEESTPSNVTLRDKDRSLWGKSFCEQLTADIEKGFKKKGKEK